MTELQKDIDKVMSPHYKAYKELQHYVHEASEKELIDWAVKRKYVMQCEWAADRITTGFYREHWDDFARNGAFIFINELPTEPVNGTAIILIDDARKYDITNHCDIVVVKQGSVNLHSDVKLFAYGTSTVTAYGNCDCLMYDDSILISESEEAWAELRDNARVIGTGHIYKNGKQI